jgi:nicotinic acid mononucleotide adenylyltransferase
MKDPIHFSQQTIQRYKQVQSLLDQLHPESTPHALILPGSPSPAGNIIVFPGSFNPPTNAHLALLKQAERFAHSPTLSATGDHQGLLLYAAISKRTTDKENVDRPLMLDRIILLDTLLKQRLPHTGMMLFNRGLYVEQAEAVRSSFPAVSRLFFLLGFDKIVQILDPHYYEDRDAALKTLFSLAELLVAPRGTANAGTLTDLLQQPQNQPFAQYIHSLPLDSAYRDISSSRIRQHGVEHLRDIPQEVRRFMDETYAYELPTRLEDGTEVDYYEERVKMLEALIQ